MKNLLIVEDDASLRESLAVALENDYNLHFAGSTEDAQRRLHQAPDDVLNRDRESEIRRRQGERLRHRRQEKPQALTHAHREAHHHRGGDQDRQGVRARRGGHGWHVSSFGPACPG